MSNGSLARPPFLHVLVYSRAIPFAVFIALMALDPWLAGLLEGVLDPRWLYGFRTLVVAGLLLLFWHKFDELAALGQLRVKAVLLAIGAGLAVLAIWLLLDSGVYVLGDGGKGFDPRSADGSLDWSLALMRLAGSVLLVPVMEELFWRSLVMRWLDNADFAAVDPAQVGIRALMLSSLVFGFEHSQWAAGIVAGLVYGWLYMRSRNLWVPVIAHAVTNAGLGFWVLANGTWHFW
ncbi:MAG: CAAX prenyl protease-related protein [Azonexus sp.]|nr:CAAX prenyl protease-related protein [Azonexus sp.]